MGPSGGAPQAQIGDKQRMIELYSSVAPTYVDQGPPRFIYVGRRLVEVAGVGAGDVVLDVATGRGAALLPAAERVGPTGRVVGIDVAPGMIECTQTAIAERQLARASVQLMDAKQLHFAGASFTHVVCSFAVFFFPELARVLGEMRRVLRPGGVVGFAFERGADPHWAWYEDLLRSRGIFERLPRLPGDATIRRKHALTTALEQDGFDDAVELVEEVTLGYPDAETWWASLWTHGSRSALDALTPEELGEIKAICLEKARAQAGADGLPERHQFIYVTARKTAA